MAVRTVSAAFICWTIIITLPAVLSAYQAPAVVAANPELNAGLEITIALPSSNADSFAAHLPAHSIANRQLSLPPFSLSVVRAVFTSNATTPDPSLLLGVLQLHSCLHPLSLSYTRDLRTGQHQNGTNLGLLVHRDRLTFYVHNYNYYTPVEASLALIAHDAGAPQPGACSLESAMPELPSLQVQSAADDTLVNVDTPLAADNRGQCGGPPLAYQFYALWMPRADFTCATYFEAIRAMQSPRGIRQNGLRSVAHPYKPQRRTYARWPGTGMVVATIVSEGCGAEGCSDDIDDLYTAASAYVPAYIAPCSPQHWGSDCQPFAAPSARLLAAFLLLVGSVRSVIQPFCMQVSLAIDAFAVGLFGALVSDGFWWRLWGGGDVSGGLGYQQTPDTASVTIAVAGGLVLAIILVWLTSSYMQITLCVSGIVSNLAGAFLLVAFVLDTLQMDDPKTSATWWFELLLAALMVAAIVTAPCYLARGRTLANACCAAFAMVQAIGMLSNRGVHGVFVVLNAVRTFRVPEYGFANSSVPYDSWDWLALATWLCLWATAMWAEVRLERWATLASSRRQQATAAALVDERTPIVTRWTAGSDDVFESPETNYRFFSRLRRNEAV